MAREMDKQQTQFLRWIKLAIVSLGCGFLVWQIAGRKVSPSAKKIAESSERPKLSSFSFEAPMLYVPNPVPADQVSEKATIGTMEDWLKNYYVSYPTFWHTNGPCRWEE